MSEIENSCQRIISTLHKIGQNTANKALHETLFQADIVSQLVATRDSKYLRGEQDGVLDKLITANLFIF